MPIARGDTATAAITGVVVIGAVAAVAWYVVRAMRVLSHREYSGGYAEGYVDALADRYPQRTLRVDRRAER